MHPLHEGLSWPSHCLIQASQVAQEGSILISWTVCGHKPSWAPPFPPFIQFSPLPSHSHHLDFLWELKFFPKYVAWPVWLVLGLAGLRYSHAIKHKPSVLSMQEAAGTETCTQHLISATVEGKQEYIQMRKPMWKSRIST